ncbi:MAG: adenosylcobinamide-GDP ribazoletransferase [Lachnospiraceae bacterium]|jgi:adenosylcobinamide-GDP ribazoletransferase|nr:adenosylcobinamide-GDP ribazoletransferase [Lachnospiraceae bacterium]
MASSEDHGRQGHPVLNSLFMAFSMYSRIPVPQAEWEGEGMGYVLCFFPVVGAVIGAVVTGFCFLADWMELGTVAFACIGTALPVLLTGGIHMDGLLDVVDARSSCQSKEKKLEILKDPHIGAFAIIGCGVYLLLYGAAFSQINRESFCAVAGIFVLERTLSGWSVVTFPKAKREGLVSTFAGEAKKKVVQISMAVWGIGAAGYIIGMRGFLAGSMAVAMAFLVFGWYYHMAKREFGGITGDLAGYFLQLCELGMLGMLVLG